MSKITKTVVINLGVTKRSDLLDEPFCIFINSDKKENSSNEGNVSAAKGNDRKTNDKDDHDDLPSDNWDPIWVWDADVNQQQNTGLLSSFADYSIEEAWIIKETGKETGLDKSYL